MSNEENAQLGRNCEVADVKNFDSANTQNISDTQNVQHVQDAPLDFQSPKTAEQDVGVEIREQLKNDVTLIDSEDNLLHQVSNLNANVLSFSISYSQFSIQTSASETQ
eukprot:TRINITY_DN18199_c0_g1_i2.p3 TRINITY_DN18199_c0_g1~~TRINITY_DN18199_c0_g1_i2.p3  ORF type:complete len:116 (-),score=14.70 TRINITY_DN18199_c0_g1_i2:165-488(-)